MKLLIFHSSRCYYLIIVQIIFCYYFELINCRTDNDYNNLNDENDLVFEQDLSSSSSSSPSSSLSSSSFSHLSTNELRKQIQFGNNELHNELNNELNMLNSNLNSNLYSTPYLNPKTSNTTLVSDLKQIDDQALLLKIQIRPGLVRFSTVKPESIPYPFKNHKKRQRNKRNRILQKGFNVNLIQDVCPSTSDWVAKTEAIDPYGNTLNIIQRIIINGTVVNQYFYETFCLYNYNKQNDLRNNNNNNNYNYNNYNEILMQHQQKNFAKYDDTECLGIDKKVWSSYCRENHIWTYGKVMTKTGEQGWSVIAIRGSCGCAIWPKYNEYTSGGRGRRVSQKQSQVYEPFF